MTLNPKIKEKRDQPIQSELKIVIQIDKKKKFSENIYKMIIIILKK